jgi:FkbM family methyltransferase
MGIRRYVKSFLILNELKQAFQTVYGRNPQKNELPLLEDLSRSPLGDKSRIFRAIIGSYDHQTLKTPFTVRFSEKDIAYIPLHGFLLAVDTADTSVSCPLAKGDYEPHLRTFYQNRLKPGMTVVDVGANIGLYTMLAAQLVGSSGRVISFEPNSENCRLILLSINKNRFNNVTLFPLALSDQAGYTFFTTALGSNGILLPTNESVLNDSSCIVISTIKMEDFISQKVDFIKVDVEGAEGLVIKGCRKLIEKHRPVVTSEFSMEMLPRISKMSGHEYLTYFKVNNYDIFMIDRNTGDLIEISSLDTFLDSYGPPTRIEDMAFIPR